MPYGLSAPLTALSFAQMPIEDLCAYQRNLCAALRDADHWHRLVGARIDLAVASVAGLEEPVAPLGTLLHGSDLAPPAHLRELVGLVATSDVRLQETGRLMQLRAVLGELEAYTTMLSDLTQEAGQVIAARVGAVRVDA